jgi:O-antigen ligase
VSNEFCQNKGWVFPGLGNVLPFLFLFFYFLFSSGELLHIVLFIFKPKIGNLVAVAFFGYFFLLCKKMVIPRPIFYAFLWLLLSQVISAFFSIHMQRSCGYIAIYVFNFIFYFLVPVNLFQVFDSGKVLKTYSMAFYCVGFYAISQVVLSLFGIYDPFAVQTVGLWARRGQAWAYEPSFYALYITAFVMFKNGIAILKVKEKFSWKDTAKLFGINFMLIASTSTGLILSYPVFCAVAFGVSLLKPLRASAAFLKGRIVKFLTVCCVVTGVLSLLFWDIIKWSLFKFFFTGLENHVSITIRWSGIVACWKLFLENPFFGIGVGGVGPYYFIKSSYYDVAVDTLEEMEPYDPTNVFTEMLASLGLVGLIGFVMLSWAFYKTFRKVIISPFISTDEKNTSVALFISLVVVVIVLQMNQGLFRPYIWIHAGTVYGYLHRLLDSKRLAN